MASPVNRQVTWAGREGQKRKSSLEFRNSENLAMLK